MTLNQLLEIGRKAGMKDTTELIEEHELLREHYHPPEKALLVYFASKYVHGDTRNFVSWYVDHQDLFDPKIQRDYHHIAQENKLRRHKQGGCGI